LLAANLKKNALPVVWRNFRAPHRRHSDVSYAHFEQHADTGNEMNSADLATKWKARPRFDVAPIMLVMFCSYLFGALTITFALKQLAQIGPHDSFRAMFRGWKTALDSQGKRSGAEATLLQLTDGRTTSFDALNPRLDADVGDILVIDRCTLNNAPRSFTLVVAGPRNTRPERVGTTIWKSRIPIGFSIAAVVGFVPLGVMAIVRRRTKPKHQMRLAGLGTLSALTLPLASERYISVSILQVVFALSCVSLVTFGELRRQTSTNQQPKTEPSDVLITQEIDNLHLTDDLTSPLLAKPGDHLIWRGEPMIVVIRTDFVEDGVRWVQVLVGDEPEDFDLDLEPIRQPDGTYIVQATNKHTVEVDAVQAESAQLTLDQHTYTFVRATTARCREVGSDGYVSNGTYQFRYFARGDEIVRCRAEQDYAIWEAERWGRNDIDLVTTVGAWTGTQRPFRPNQQT
jgi:hypothetical protein